MSFSWILLVVLNRFEEQNCVGSGSKRWKCLEFVSVEVGPEFRSTSIHFILKTKRISKLAICPSLFLLGQTETKLQPLKHTSLI